MSSSFSAVSLEIRKLESSLFAEHADVADLGVEFGSEEDSDDNDSEVDHEGPSEEYDEHNDNDDDDDDDDADSSDDDEGLCCTDISTYQKCYCSSFSISL